MWRDVEGPSTWPGRWLPVECCLRSQDIRPEGVCQGTCCSRSQWNRNSLADEMSCVSFTFRADVFSDLVAGIEIGHALDDPGFRIGSRIVNRELDFQMSQIGAAKAFDHVQHLRVPMARAVEPRLIVEPHAIDHQRIPLPMPNRVSHPSRIRILRMAASIQVDGAMAGNIVLKEHYQTRWGLNQLKWEQSSGSGDATREAMRSGSVF